MCLLHGSVEGGGWRSGGLRSGVGGRGRMSGTKVGERGGWGGGGRGHASQNPMPSLTSLNKWNVSHIASFVTTLQSVLRFDYGLDDPEIPLFWSWDLDVEVPKGTGYGFPGSTRFAAHLHTIPRWIMSTTAPEQTSKSAWLGDSLGTNTNSPLLSQFSCALLLVGPTYPSAIPDKGRRSSPAYHNGYLQVKITLRVHITLLWTTSLGRRNSTFRRQTYTNCCPVLS
jgi:hypothetical protein